MLFSHSLPRSSSLFVTSFELVLLGSVLFCSFFSSSLGFVDSETGAFKTKTFKNTDFIIDNLTDFDSLYSAFIVFEFLLIIIYCISNCTRQSMWFDLHSRFKKWPPSASLLPTASLSSSLSSNIRCLALSKTDFKTMESSKI